MFFGSGGQSVLGEWASFLGTANGSDLTFLEENMTQEDFNRVLSQIPSRGIYWREHLWVFSSIPSITGASGSGAEALALAQSAGSATNFGEARARLNTTNGAYVGQYFNAYKFYLGSGIVRYEARILCSSIITNSPRFQFGLTSGTSPAAGADQVDGCYIESDPAVSANWLRVTSKASTRTRNISGTTTGSAVAVTNASHIFVVEVNADASSVEFFVDGTSLGVETTNIPLTTTNLSPGYTAYMATYASGNNVIYADYFETFCLFTTQKTS